MSRVSRVISLLALVAIGYSGYRWYSSAGDEGRIRAALDELAATVSQSGGEGLAQMARAAKLGSFFASDVEIDLGPPYAPFSGRETLVAMAAKVRVGDRELDVRFVDVEVDVSAGGVEAIAHMTATAADRGGLRDGGIDAREVETRWRRIDGEWVITRVTGVETLERPR